MRQQNRSYAVWLVIFSVGAWNSRASPLEGIQSVLATKDTIICAASATGGVLRVAELEPYPSAPPLVVSNASISPQITAQFPRFDGRRDRIYSSFILLRETRDAQWMRLGTNRFVDEIRGVSKNTDPFPRAASKKGLQIQMLDDALTLGVKHAALNINLNQMIDLKAGPTSLDWPVDDQTHYFKRSYIEGLDHQVKTLSGTGVVVSLILLNYESNKPELNKITLHPSYDRSCPNHLSAFNTTTLEGMRFFKACIEFLAARYSQAGYPHGRAVNFIVGNEVNSHWFWCNMGHVSMETFANDYLRTVRLCHTALRKYSSTARVYLSLEHHWNIRYPGGDGRQTFAARSFLDYFNRSAAAQGNFDWHLAFHPYPENLFEPRTWNDKSATFAEDSPRITFKNLEMLPRYLSRVELLYAGRPRRVILSEQGFHTPDGPEGERQQAAAYAYAIYRAEHIEGIDSMILNRHVDHRDEGGLRLGLWRRNEKSSNPAEPTVKKQIYEVFHHADLPDWSQAFEFALPVIGIQRWEELLPK